MEPIYSPLLHRAVEFASARHVGQWRMNPNEKTPYISHPFCVGLILSRAGYDDEVEAAGILHDVVEDCGVTAEELEDKFGERVATLVLAVSEDKSVEAWEVRKRMYREVLERAPSDAVAVAVADHLHNVRSLVMSLVDDPSMRNAFSVGLPEKLGHEQACLELFRRRLPGPLTEAFAHAVDDMERRIRG